MSPEERAKELGVKVIPAREPIKRREVIPLGDSQKYKLTVPIVAVCGGCGSDIRQNELRQACGKENCPFGILSMQPSSPPQY